MFLLRDARWRSEVVWSQELWQGYLSTDPERMVRVRLVNDATYLTLKGVRVVYRRLEFEYPIDAQEARLMLEKMYLRSLVHNRRHWLDRSPGEWTVDEFADENAGLILAEAEVPEALPLPEVPSWMGREVTDDNRFANSLLRQHPYSSWRHEASQP